MDFTRKLSRTRQISRIQIFFLVAKNSHPFCPMNSLSDASTASGGTGSNENKGGIRPMAKTTKKASSKTATKKTARASGKPAKKSTKKKTASKSTKKKAPTKKATVKKTVKEEKESVSAEPQGEPIDTTAVSRGPDRRKVQRRRQIDPTTCERDYSNEEIEFMRAMDEYKRNNGRMFPTCSEILEVVRALGYVRQDPADQPLIGETATGDGTGADSEYEDTVTPAPAGNPMVAPTNDLDASVISITEPFKQF